MDQVQYGQEAHTNDLKQEAHPKYPQKICHVNKHTQKDQDETGGLPFTGLNHGQPASRHRYNNTW